MNETPKIPIWMLIIISILSAIIVIGVVLQLLLQISLSGLVPFSVAGLMLMLGISYFRSPKRDFWLLMILIVVFVINVVNGILQLLGNV